MSFHCFCLSCNLQTGRIVGGCPGELAIISCLVSSKLKLEYLQHLTIYNIALNWTFKSRKENYISGSLTINQ